MHTDDRSPTAMAHGADACLAHEPVAAEIDVQNFLECCGIRLGRGTENRVGTGIVDEYIDSAEPFGRRLK